MTDLGTVLIRFPSGKEISPMSPDLVSLIPPYVGILSSGSATATKRLGIPSHSFDETLLPICLLSLLDSLAAKTSHLWAMGSSLQPFSQEQDPVPGNFHDNRTLLELARYRVTHGAPEGGMRLLERFRVHFDRTRDPKGVRQLLALVHEISTVLLRTAEPHDGQEPAVNGASEKHGHELMSGSVLKCPEGEDLRLWDAAQATNCVHGRLGADKESK
jgi:hypothetical protein